MKSIKSAHLVVTLESTIFGSLTGPIAANDRRERFPCIVREIWER